MTTKLLKRQRGQYPEPVDPTADTVAVGGIALQEPGRPEDEAATITRSGDQLHIKDGFADIFLRDLFTRQEHSQLLTLAHVFNLSGYKEIIRDANSRVSSIIFWTSVGKTAKYREYTITRAASGLVSGLTRVQYDGQGHVLETLVLTIGRNALQQVSSVTYVRS